MHSVFFFSSRRRHTRLQGDWSSDVCSSDLGAAADFVREHAEDPALSAARMSAQRARHGALVCGPAGGSRRRSAGTASGSSEPAGNQTQDEPLAQKTTRTLSFPPANKEVS